jgi:hypothetical protein
MLLTKWTIRLALVCYVAYLAGGLSRLNCLWSRAARALWTLGCLLFTVHVACAFHFYHQWSHAFAWRCTAERTRQLLGVEFGDGIYFSYLFLVLWIVDIVCLWGRAPPSEPTLQTLSLTAVSRIPRRQVQPPCRSPVSAGLRHRPGGCWFTFSCYLLP